MASFVLGKTKRKGFDEVYDEFSSLSLSAPAAKTRRLNAELPPVMEMGPIVDHQQTEGFMPDAVADAVQVPKTPMVNKELALVLYKPLDPHFSLTFQVDPKLMSDLKNPALWPGNQCQSENFVVEQQSSTGNRLAVIPWVSTVSGPSTQDLSASGTVVEDAMEAAEDGESMEIENELGQLVGAGVGAGSPHQWQQHCMIPALSQVPSTPILGSW